jgi:polysaccharide chain length determinant protein (PEP-CTERM system associated)
MSADVIERLHLPVFLEISIATSTIYELMAQKLRFNDDQEDLIEQEPIADSKSLEDYLQIFRRRKYYIVLPILPLILISFMAAMLLPPVFHSSAVVLIEEQHIPTELVKSTVSSYADERIKQIQQKITTTEIINKIIDKFDVYADEKKKLTPVELAENFKLHTTLDLISADVINNGRKAVATMAFKLGFDHKKPDVAQKVVNELVSLYLSENIRKRTEQAAETSNFLESETDKFKLEIQKAESAIADFKQKNSDSLPEMLTTNLASQSRIETELQQLDLQEKMIQERISSLRLQLTIVSPVNTPRRENKTARDLPDTLPELQAEYDRLITNFNESHPDVKAVKRKMLAMEQSQNSADPKHAIISNPAFLQIQSDLDSAQIELSNIAKQRQILREKLNQLDLSISKTHQVERGYDELMRDLENNKKKYQDLKSKSLDARLAVSMEEEGKSEKFTLQEPPSFPIKPEKPNRMKVMLMGMVVSIGIGFGLGLLVEFTDGTIRGRNALHDAIGLDPLVMIPYISNEDDELKAKKEKMFFTSITIVFIVVFLAAVHVLYMPLDVLYEKLSIKINSMLNS